MTAFALSVLEADRSIDGRPDESILDACLTAGLPFPYNCRSGECGECLARLVRGTVQELPGADPAVFNDDHRGRGLILACLCYPRTDLELSVALRAEAGPSIRDIDSVVERIERHGPNIVEVTVRMDEPVDYRAGQYFEWVLPGVPANRSYSAANRPGGSCLKFHVRLYEQGVVSRLLSSGQLTLGDILTLRGPFGSFQLSSDDQRPAILVAGGTGMAPIMALLEDAFAKGLRRRFRYFYGTRRREDLYHVETLEAWARAHDNLSFMPVLSDEPAASDWAGARGLVTDAVGRDLRDGFGAEAYLCGPPPMVDAAIPLLESRGVDRADIHYDKFTPVS